MGVEDFDVMVCLGIRRSDLTDCLQTGVLDLVSKALEMFWVMSIAEGIHQPLQCSKRLLINPGHSFKDREECPNAVANWMYLLHS